MEPTVESKVPTVESRARELIMLQLGSQVLALCEANARLEIAMAQLAEAQKPKKAGSR